MAILNVTLNAKGVVKGAKTATKALGTIGKAGRSLISSVFSPLNAAIAGIGGGAALIGITKITDQFTVMASQLEFATKSAEDAETVERQLYEVSKLTGTQLKDNADSYVKLTQAQKLTGLSSDDNIKVIGALNSLMIKTGTSGVQASAAMLQLSQALTSGQLAGDEFRSMAENAPGLLNAMGEAMGIPREELKAMSAAGELTSERMGKALLSIAESGEVAFDDLPKTVAKGWNAVVLAFQEAWDQVNDDTGIMGQLSDALMNLSDWIEEKTPVFSKWIQEMAEAIAANWPMILQSVNDLWDRLTGFVNDLKINVPGIIQSVTTISTAIMLLLGWIAKAVEGFNYLYTIYKKFKAVSEAEDQKAFSIKGDLDAGHSASDVADAHGMSEEDVMKFGSQSNNYFNVKVNKKDVENIATMGDTAGARI